MIHYSCDLCGKDLPAGSPRYTVRIEVFAAAEADSTDPDLLNKPTSFAGSANCVTWLIRWTIPRTCGEGISIIRPEGN